jgi:hypothetical protein
MIVGALVLVAVTVAITEVSMIRKLSRPRARNPLSRSVFV